MPSGITGYPGFSAEMERGTKHVEASLQTDRETFRGGHKGKGGVVGTPNDLGGGTFPMKVGALSQRGKKKRK